MHRVTSLAPAGTPADQSDVKEAGKALKEDQLVVQIKKKMTCDEFIRNNRGINGGENLPQEFLRSLYESISRNEIRISSEATAAASPVLWTQLAQASMSPRGAVLSISAPGKLNLLRWWHKSTTREIRCGFESYITLGLHSAFTGDLDRC